jgi:transient receptor potential cation channel subfamily V protein 6
MFVTQTTFCSTSSFALFIHQFTLISHSPVLTKLALARYHYAEALSHIDYKLKFQTAQIYPRKLFSLLLLICSDWNAALILILNGTKPEHLDMLDGGIIERLLEEKWKTFAQQQFLKRLLILFVHLFFMSISVYTRPSRLASKESDDGGSGDSELVSEAMTMEPEIDGQAIVRYICECATIAGVVSFVVFQQGDELKNQGLNAFMKQLKQAPAKAIFLFSNFLILSCIPCRIMGNTEMEEKILCFAVPGSWFFMMFFAG